MKPTIGRVCVHAKPHRTHPEFQQWEIARIVILVQADTRDAALCLARQILAKHQFELLSVESCDRLIDDRVREQGGEFLVLYESALLGQEAIRVFPQNFAAGRNGIPPIRPPRVTEEFIDRVVGNVGGVRLVTDCVKQKADYRIKDWIFELKDLQEEGLEHPERQKKLAALFSPYAVDDNPIVIDPSVLTEQERQRYFDILGSTIQGAVKSASKQIRATKEAIGEGGLHGGIIYVNTGYGSFPQEEFGPTVERYVRKDTSQIEVLFCISTWVETNGFDSQVFFRTCSDKPECEIIRELKTAFSQHFEAAMTQLIHGTLPRNAPLADPLTPVAFRVDGLDFAWMPQACLLHLKRHDVHVDFLGGDCFSPKPNIISLN